MGACVNTSIIPSINVYEIEKERKKKKTPDRMHKHTFSMMDVIWPNVPFVQLNLLFFFITVSEQIKTYLWLFFFKFPNEKWSSWFNRFV